MAPLETAPDPYLNMTGGLTPLVHLEWEAKFHAPALEDVCLPSGIPIGTRNSLSELERNPEFPVSTRDEALVACTNVRGISRGQSQLDRIPDFPETT